MPLSPDILTGLSRRLADHAGLELPGWVVEARAQARIAALGVAPADYLALVGTPRGEAELHELIELVRVGETRLFRHLPQIEALATLVPPRVRGKRAIKVWSAGCATGEEPTTLAVVLARLLPGCEVSILATDVSADALEIAEAGRYPAAAIDHVPPAWRDAFVVDGGGLRALPELAACVRYERHNLLDDAFERGFDLVWCRNVLIYFAAAARRRVVDRFVGALAPGGLLFVGYSETLRDVGELEALGTGAYARATGAPPRRTPVSGVPITIAPMPTPIPPVVTERRIVLTADSDVPETTRELGAILGAKRRLTVEVGDGAPDELGPVLRRARAAGLALAIVATSPDAKKWVRRHKLEDAP